MIRGFASACSALVLALQSPAAAAAADCGYHFTITPATPDAEAQRAPLGLMLINGPDVRIEFDSLDDGLIALTGGRRTIMLGNKSVETEVRLAEDIGPEVKGDRVPAYMPDGIVLRSGPDWFAAGQATFSSTGQGQIYVGTDFLDRFLGSGAFEIWHRGRQRLTVSLVPDSGAALPDFRAACAVLFAPAASREGVARPALFQRVGQRAKPELIVPSPFDGSYRGNPLSTENVQPGSAEFRITVSRGGRIRQCNVGKAGNADKVTGRIALRPQACDMLRTAARFLPATNARGEPVEAETTFAVQWQGLQPSP